MTPHNLGPEVSVCPDPDFVVASGLNETREPVQGMRRVGVKGVDTLPPLLPQPLLICYPFSSGIVYRPHIATDTIETQEQLTLPGQVQH